MQGRFAVTHMSSLFIAWLRSPSPAPPVWSLHWDSPLVVQRGPSLSPLPCAVVTATPPACWWPCWCLLPFLGKIIHTVTLNKSRRDWQRTFRTMHPGITYAHLSRQVKAHFHHWNLSSIKKTNFICSFIYHSHLLLGEGAGLATWNSQSREVGYVMKIKKWVPGKWSVLLVLRLVSLSGL